MASVKRESQEEDEGIPNSKRPKKNTSPSPSRGKSFPVVLNPADSNLDFNIEGDGLMGHGLYEEGFAYCWSGARANVGIRGGKYCFGFKIVSAQPVKMEDTPINQQNVCRVGISRGDNTVGNLGETEQSYGFGGTGKFSNAGRFVDYGETFGIGDTIVCLVDLESRPCASIEFSKNGKRLGVAKKFDAGPRGLGVIDCQAQKLPWESAMFPHILLKNTVVEMQFSIEDGLVPVEGFKPWASAMSDGKAVVGPSFSEPTECEVIMMVGLPASGKTTWAEKWAKEHPEKRYVLLGTNLALDQMKVPGLLRKNNYGERFDRLMDRATGIFNTLLSRASKVLRNYIIDQTNVYKSARKRKLKPFAFYHKIAVVIFPTLEELKIRAERRFREMGKEVPAEAVNQMLANFVLPMSKDMRGTDEYFDQVIFPELDREEAQRQLEEMKHALALAPNGNSSNISPYSSASSVHSDSRVSGYSSSNYDNPPYHRGSSLHSDSRASACTLPGPRQIYSGYSDPLPGVRGVGPGGSSEGPPMPDMHLYPAIPANMQVYTRYTGRAPPDIVGRGPGLEPLGPFRYDAETGRRCTVHPGGVEPSSWAYEGGLNPMPSRGGYHGTYSSYRSSHPRDDLPQYGGYMHDPLRRHDYLESFGAPTEYTSSPADVRAAPHPPLGSSYGAPNPRPYAQHPGSYPYAPPPPRY